VRELANEANFASLTVNLRSGAAMTHVMWVDADDDHVLINTEVHRAKFEAVRRDPRVTVMIWVRDDPYSYAEVRGRIVETVHGPEARAHIDALSQKYLGRDYDPARIQSERVILRIAPDVQHVR
jgi:PPOX class probable F420-dependent enzyme